MAHQNQVYELGPWVCRFVVDDVDTGGWFDVMNEDAPRVNDWLQTIPNARTILDCGSFEGGHTALLSRGRSRVMGVEARESNIKRARFAHELLGVSNSSFVQANLEHGILAQIGNYDATWCSGLLYHLSRPVQFLRELRSERVFIGTHYASHGVEVSDGAHGSWRDEPNRVADTIGGLSPRSFWLSLDSLRDAVTACGYEIEKEMSHDTPNGGWVDMHLTRTR